MPSPDVLKDGAQIQLMPTANAKKEYDKTVFTQYQTAVDAGDYKPIYFNANQQNEKCALEARVLKATPGVDQDTMNAFVRFVKRHLSKILKFKHIKSDTIDEYLRNSNASPSVKQQVRESYDELESIGITVDSNLSRKFCRRATSRKSFVKVENQLYASEFGVKVKAPRLIQGARSEFIALVGPWFSSFQRYVKSKWNKDHFIYFTSGATTKEMGEYISGNGQIFENDVSAYDASISKELCQLEIWIARQFGAPQAVLQLMLANIDTHGYTSCGWRYSVEGTRKSGDPYTSVFNSMLNALMHLFVFMKQTKLSISDARQSIKMLVQGDDNLMRHGGDRIVWRDTFLKLGFDTESIYRANLSEAEFCSSVLMPTKTGHTFVPKLGRVLAKFGYFINPPINVPPAAIIRGVCLGFGPLNVLPWFKSFLTNMLERYRSDRVHYLKDHEFKAKLVGFEIDDYMDAVFYFTKRYDFDYTNLTDLCHELRTFSGVCDHPLVKWVIARDTDGPKW